MLKLTIAIPNYNGSKFLGRNLDSCLGINLKKSDYEILVVDNCSTDNSVDIVNRYRKDNKNIVLKVNKSNIGRIENWSKCLSFARGKYILFMMISDTYLNYDFNDKLKLLDEHNEVSMVTTSFIIELPNGFKKQVKKTPKNNCFYSSEQFLLINFKKGILPFYALQSNILRVSDIKNYHVRFSNAYEYGADNIFCSELLTKRKLVYIDHKPLLKWTLKDNQARLHNRLSLEEKVNNDIYICTSIMNKLGYYFENECISAILGRSFLERVCIQFIVDLNIKGLFMNAITFHNIVSKYQIKRQKVFTQFLLAVFSRLL